MIGQPSEFICAKCRITFGHAVGQLVGRNVHTTGRVKHLRAGARPTVKLGKWSWTTAAYYEYVCRDCGHKGWSRHPDVESMFDMEHPTDHQQTNLELT